MGAYTKVEVKGTTVWCYQTTNATGTSMSQGRKPVAMFNNLLNDAEVAEQIRKRLDDLMFTGDSSEEQTRKLETAKRMRERFEGGVALESSKLDHLDDLD